MKSPFASHQQHSDEACLEESDEVKSNYSETSCADFLYLESGESQEPANKSALTQELQQADMSNKETDKFVHKTGSAESCLLQYPNSDYELDEITSPVYDHTTLESSTADFQQRTELEILESFSPCFGNMKKECDRLCTVQSDDVCCYAEDRTKAASKMKEKKMVLTVRWKQMQMGKARGLSKQKKGPPT
ncbi:hypothetical protein Tco_1328580 [Tanacetum coccineum]